MTVPGATHLHRTWLVALSLLALSACGGSGGSAPPAGGATTTPFVSGGTLGLGIVGLVVRDLPASLAFYRQLGLAVPADADTSSGAYRLRQPNGQILFWETVDYVRGFDPAYQPATGDRRVVLEFGFARPSDVNAMHDRLVAAGAPSRLAPVSWSGDTIRYAIVIDPDGNQISLRWPLAS